MTVSDAPGAKVDFQEKREGGGWLSLLDMKSLENDLESLRLDFHCMFACHA